MKCGELACYAAVQDLGRGGLEGALDTEDIRRFEAWRKTTGSVCWFFIDSVDEGRMRVFRHARHSGMAVNLAEKLIVRHPSALLTIRDLAHCQSLPA
ncbi:hypothetical protein A6B35_32125 (plasmid) [Mesorhizobium amorphae CCNWGS0123]|nr:hypothetical protein A6B35_32125 [Mesorhizobium amorphae CCNWGS0123]